jgi:hypothetical protein
MVAELDVVGIARNRRREALRIGAEGCEENDLTARRSEILPENSCLGRDLMTIFPAMKRR